MCCPALWAVRAAGEEVGPYECDRGRTRDASSFDPTGILPSAEVRTDGTSLLRWLESTTPNGDSCLREMKALCPPVRHLRRPRADPQLTPDFPLLRSYSHPIRELCSRRACAPATEPLPHSSPSCSLGAASPRRRVSQRTDRPRATPLRRNSSFRPVSRDVCVWERLARCPTPVPRLKAQNGP